MARASVVIVAGLVLALAATLAPLSPDAGAPGASLSVRVPALVQMLVLALFAASALLLLLLQRPRRPSEDGLAPARVRRRTSAWTAFVSLLPFLGLLAVAWYYVATHPPGDDTPPIARAIGAISGLFDLLALARKPPVSIPFVDVAIATLVLAGALALFGLLLLVTFADWLAARGTPDAGITHRETVAPPADPRLEPDPRAAIMLAWAAFERALAGARAPRAPWQTPAELMRAAVARLPLPGAAVARLTALFEVARFSDRPLGAEARAAACASLDEITTALAEDAARAR